MATVSEATGVFEIMDFSEFANILRPYYGQNDTKYEFVMKLFDSILDDYNESAKDNEGWQNKEKSYNPLYKIGTDTVTRYFNGIRISPDTYKEMLKYLNMQKFTSFMENPVNPTDEMDSDLSAALKHLYPDINEENYCEKYADLFMKIIQKGAREPKSAGGRNKIIHYPEETSASTMEDLESTIYKTALLISKKIKEPSLPEDPKIAVCVAQKITKNHHLRRTVESDLIYFDVVNDAFCEAGKNEGKPAAFICSSVHRYYEKLKAQKYSEEDIVKNMQKYFSIFALTSDAESEALRIIVSYFIQLCEVFDAPSR